MQSLIYTEKLNPAKINWLALWRALAKQLNFISSLSNTSSTHLGLIQTIIQLWLLAYLLSFMHVSYTRKKKSPGLFQLNKEEEERQNILQLTIIWKWNENEN